MDDADGSGEGPRYDAFISHARDAHESVARPLYEHLTDAGLRVRVDGRDLDVESSVSGSIDRAILASGHVVVVLSETYLNSEHLARELEELLRRRSRNAEQRGRILPLYYGVDPATVREFSPALAGLRAVTVTEENVDSVAERVAEAILDGDAEAFPGPPDETTVEGSLDETAVWPDGTAADAAKAAVGGAPTGEGTGSVSRRLRAFLSHSKADRLVVNEIRTNLESSGIEVYVYEDDRRPGVSIPTKVQNAIDGSDLMIAIQTSNSADSQWIRDEMVWASARDVPLVPILESELPPPGGILGRDVEVVRYTLGEEERLIEDLMDALRVHTTGRSDDEIRELGTIMGSSIGPPLERVQKPRDRSRPREPVGRGFLDPEPDPETPATPLRERIRERVDGETSMGEFSQVVREEVVDAVGAIQDEHVPGPIPDAFWEAVLGVYAQTMSETSRETIVRNFETFRETYRRVVLIEPGTLPGEATRSGHEVAVKRPWRPADLYTDEAWRERIATHDIPVAVRPHVVVVPGEFTDDWLQMTQYSAFLVGSNALAVEQELARQRGTKPLWKLLGELGEVPSGTLGRIGFVLSSNVRSVTTLFKTSLREYLGYLVLREAFETRGSVG